MRAPSRCPRPRSTCWRRSASGRPSPSTRSRSPASTSPIRASKPACGRCCWPTTTRTERRRAGDLHRPRRPADRSAARQGRRASLRSPCWRRRRRRASPPTRRARALQLADGREIAASLVVAADGRKSPLRDAAGIKVIGWSYAQTGIVTTVRHDRPHGGRAVQHFLPAGPFAILPLTGNRVCITWTEEAREATRILALDDAGFLAEVEKRFGGKLGAIALDGPRQSWPLELHLARRYVGAALRAPRRRGARRASAGGAGAEPRVSRCRGAGGGRSPIACASASMPAMRRRSAAMSAGAVSIRPSRRRRSTASTGCSPATRRCCARRARSASASSIASPALKRFFVGEAAGLTGELPRLLQGRSRLAGLFLIGRLRSSSGVDAGMTTTTRPPAMSTTGTNASVKATSSVTLCPSRRTSSRSPAP